MDSSGVGALSRAKASPSHWVSKVKNISSIFSHFLMWAWSRAKAGLSHWVGKLKIFHQFFHIFLCLFSVNFPKIFFISILILVFWVEGLSTQEGPGFATGLVFSWGLKPSGPSGYALAREWEIPCNANFVPTVTTFSLIVVINQVTHQWCQSGNWWWRWILL